MAILQEGRDGVNNSDTEGAAVTTGKSSPASSATTSDISDETRDSTDMDPTHQESSVYDGLSPSPTSSNDDNEEEVPIPMPELPHIQPDSMIYPIDQSPTGSWGHPWGHFHGGADAPHQTVERSQTSYDSTQLPMKDSVQFAQVRSGVSNDEDVGYSSDGEDSVVSNSSDVSMDVNYNG